MLSEYAWLPFSSTGSRFWRCCLCPGWFRGHGESWRLWQSGSSSFPPCSLKACLLQGYQRQLLYAPLLLALLVLLTHSNSLLLELAHLLLEAELLLPDGFGQRLLLQSQSHQDFLHFQHRLQWRSLAFGKLYLLELLVAIRPAIAHSVECGHGNDAATAGHIPGIYPSQWAECPAGPQRQPQLYCRSAQWFRLESERPAMHRRLRSQQLCMARHWMHVSHWGNFLVSDCIMLSLRLMGWYEWIEWWLTWGCMLLSARDCVQLSLAFDAGQVMSPQWTSRIMLCLLPQSCWQDACQMLSQRWQKSLKYLWMDTREYLLINKYNCNYTTEDVISALCRPR